jgi:hypothetical protein
MVHISEASARDIARTVTNLPGGTEGHTWLVRRLDRQDEYYWLVALGSESAVEAVVAVEAADGKVMNYARLAPPGSFGLLSAEEAVRVLEEPGFQAVELVWMPCRASYSPLYPLWEVRTKDRTVYINQQRQMWEILDVGKG